MHHRFDIPPRKDSGLDIETESAGIGARLQNMGRHIVGAFQGHNAAISCAALGGVIIPPELIEHAFHDTTPPQDSTNSAAL